jgi:hypothetical protein
MAVDSVDIRAREAGWGRVALLAGTISGIGLLAQTVLFLLDASGVLPGIPPFRETGAGRDEDLAAFFIAFAERQHDVAWDIVLRDVLGPIAAVALIVLARALVHLRGAGRAGPQVWALVFGVGALLMALSDLVYLSQMSLWRDTGFVPEPPADMIAVGRTSEAITALADYLEYAAFVLLAAGIAGLAARLGRRLEVLAYALAVGLLVSVVASLARYGTVYDITALVTGVLLAPALLLGLGRSLAHSVDHRP